MEKPKPDFNQGFIKVTYPYTWQMWLVWGLIFFGACSVVGYASFSGDIFTHRPRATIAQNA
jgi:hypothetical protein